MNSAKKGTVLKEKATKSWRKPLIVLQKAAVPELKAAIWGVEALMLLQKAPIFNKKATKRKLKAAKCSETDKALLLFLF